MRILLNLLTVHQGNKPGLNVCNNLNMRIIKRIGYRITSVIILCFCILPFKLVAQPDGEKLFKTNCTACHTSTDKKLIGPGLAGVVDRWEDKDLLYRWIRNSDEVKKLGDPYVTALVSQFNNAPMPAQSLKDEEITAILDFIMNPPAAAVAAAGPAADAGAVAVEEEPAIPYSIVFGAVVVLLLILISMLRSLKYVLLRIRAEKEGQEAPVQPSMLGAVSSWIGHNKTFFAVILIVFTVGLAKAGWDWLLNVGIYEGYAPEQPIKFSHKVHAGTQKIDCNYCHSSARNSKTSGIPSANVCMNCHKFISEGPITGTAEIAKIYAAIGWNPGSQVYNEEPTGPIKWVKVHNLPDHAYFNHSQHVTVGKIACQTCHGPVEEMDVVRQHTQMTMGWCINCHRETNVMMEGSEYYDEIHARMPHDMKESVLKDGKITVSEIGGLECAKCHY